MVHVEYHVCHIPFSHEIGLDRQQIYARRDNNMRACVIQPKSNHTPLHRNARALAISLPAFPPSYATSARIYRPGETLMTQCTHYGFFRFFCTERIDERNIKAPTAASKARPTTSEGAWVFFIRKCRNAAGQQVKVHKSASFVDILEVCKFTIFCD